MKWITEELALISMLVVFLAFAIAGKSVSIEVTIVFCTQLVISAIKTKR